MPAGFGEEGFVQIAIGNGEVGMEGPFRDGRKAGEVGSGFL